MPPQVSLPIAKFGAAVDRVRRRAQQSGGAMKETAGWPKGAPSV
jgi:hypothetical protein